MFSVHESRLKLEKSKRKKTFVLFDPQHKILLLGSSMLILKTFFISKTKITFSDLNFQCVTILRNIFPFVFQWKSECPIKCFEKIQVNFNYPVQLLLHLLYCEMCMCIPIKCLLFVNC